MAVVDKAVVSLPKSEIHDSSSVTRKKSPNVYKSCPKIISLEKLKIFIALQKLPKNVGDFGQINCCQRL